MAHRKKAQMTKSKCQNIKIVAAGFSLREYFLQPFYVAAGFSLREYFLQPFYVAAGFSLRV